MATEPSLVLGPNQLNEADERVLAELREGRVTPSLISERTDLGRSYISQRLIRLEEHGHVDELARGLYELVNDPQEDMDTDRPNSNGEN